MAIIFNQRVKHGKIDFHPGVTYGFEDPDAAPYFKACGWADEAPAGTEPAVTLTLGEIDIDPTTVFGSGPKKGARVLGGDE